MSQKNEIFVSTSVKYWPITNKNWSYRKKILYHFKVKNVKSCRIEKEMSDYAFTFV